MTRSVLNHRRASTGVLLSSDSFNRADNASIGSTDGTGTRDSLTWASGGQLGSAVFGSVSIVSNQAKSGTGTRLVKTVDLGTADVELHVATSPTTGGSGLCFRYLNTNNLWRFQLITSLSVSWGLQKYAAGTLTPLGSAILRNTGDIGIVICSGNQITALVRRAGGGDVIAYSGTDSFNGTQTRHGMSFDRDNDVLDDWSAYSA